MGQSDTNMHFKVFHKSRIYIDAEIHENMNDNDAYIDEDNIDDVDNFWMFK